VAARKTPKADIGGPKRKSRTPSAQSPSQPQSAKSTASDLFAAVEAAKPTGTNDRVRRLAPIGIQRQPGVDGLIEIRDPERRREDLVLSTQNGELMTGLVDEYRASDKLRRHGLAPRAKVLFCGPPGCGKTLTAEVFARELSLPLVTMRLEAVISSFLGETASNLANIFAAVERQPCVLFLDEFDVIGRTRESAHDHNELRRVVNSLLLLIDRFKGRGFLIAATNLEHTIDHALWRRFDEVVLFDPPDSRQIRQMLQLKTKNFPADFAVADRASDMSGMSFAEIERICVAAIKTGVMRGAKTFSADDFDRALKSEQRRRAIRDRVKNRVGEKGE
jgi:SpoVK/Ycf46/Vps4 family AAA+-type ATPase